MDRASTRGHRLVGEEGKRMSKYVANYSQALKALESYCAIKDYSGYCKFDALNSPILSAFFGSFYISRLIATQMVNRIPGLRTLFLVKKGRNPKGVANFIRAYSKMDGSRAKVVELANWLLEHDSRSYGKYSGPGRAWGYHFPWQSPGFFQPAHAPNCIVTVFCAESLLDAYAVTQESRYREAAFSATSYLLEYLPVIASDTERLCLGYVRDGLSWRVVNINAVVAGFLTRLHRFSGEEKYLELSQRLIRWVLDARDPETQLWNYTDPKKQSGIGPDNYHVGGILEGIGEWLAETHDSRRGQIEKEYLQALQIYGREFFTKDGAPRWRLDRNYPMDIHGSAQGILTFVQASRRYPEYLDLARKIADWAIEKMQDQRTGRFYYQRYPFFTWKVDLMRWNNSWMMRALAELQQRLMESAR